MPRGNKKAVSGFAKKHGVPSGAIRKDKKTKLLGKDEVMHCPFCERDTIHNRLGRCAVCGATVFQQGKVLRDRLKALGFRD